LEHY